MHAASKVVHDLDAGSSTFIAAAMMSEDATHGSTRVRLQSLTACAELAASFSADYADGLCVLVSAITPSVLQHAASVWHELPTRSTSALRGRATRTFFKGALDMKRNEILVYPRVSSGAFAEYVQPEDVLLQLNDEVGALVEARIGVQRTADDCLQLLFAVEEECSNTLDISVCVCGVEIAAPMRICCGAFRFESAITSPHFNEVLTDKISAKGLRYYDGKTLLELCLRLSPTVRARLQQAVTELSPYLADGKSMVPDFQFQERCKSIIQFELIMVNGEPPLHYDTATSSLQPFFVPMVTFVPFTEAPGVLRIKIQRKLPISSNYGDSPFHFVAISGEEVAVSSPFEVFSKQPQRPSAKEHSTVTFVEITPDKQDRQARIKRAFVGQYVDSAIVFVLKSISSIRRLSLAWPLL